MEIYYCLQINNVHVSVRVNSIHNNIHDYFRMSKNPCTLLDVHA